MLERPLPGTLTPRNAAGSERGAGGVAGTMTRPLDAPVRGVLRGGRSLLYLL